VLLSLQRRPFQQLQCPHLVDNLPKPQAVER